MDSTISPDPNCMFENIKYYMMPIDQVLEEQTGIFIRIIEQNVTSAMKNIQYEGNGFTDAECLKRQIIFRLLLGL